MIIMECLASFRLNNQGHTEKGSESMRKIVAAVVAVFFTFNTLFIPAKAASTTESRCVKPQFSIIVNKDSELKAKADQTSETIQTYAVNKQLSVMKRSGNWYQICHGKKMAYLPIEKASEIFTTEEKVVLIKADKKKNVEQLIAATGKKLDSTKVTIRVFEKRKGEWRRALTTMQGVIGKNGFAKNKKEGDGKSPIGMFSLGTAFGSQAKPAKLKIAYKKVTKYDFWIDDVTSPDYNKWKTYNGNPSKKWKSFERMNHELYQYGAVINYNTKPIVKGKGSAIFLHIWRSEQGTTAGCVATSEKNVLTLLRWIDPTKNTHMILGTKSTLADL